MNEKERLENEKKEIEKKLKEIKDKEKSNSLKRKLLHKKDARTICTVNTCDNNYEAKVNNNSINVSLLIVLVFVIAIISGFLGAFLVLKTNTTTTTENGVTTSTVELNETNSISTAVSKVYDAVVVVEGYANNELYSTGTGFVYKKDGGKAYIMTNSHVISDCDVVKVLFTSGDEIETDVVGSDTYSDIAVLSVDDSDDISAATMGESEKSAVGDTVFTVGSPEGADYAGTVTKGVLSGKDRLVAVALSNSSTSDYYMSVLQTDAAINPGNSGGPLCNTNGEVIGITNMKLVDSSVEGMGFAIPIEDALEYAEILEEDGKIVRPYVGISMLDISSSYYLWQAGITIPDGVTSGVVVYEVESNSPADKAGLEKGDIIIKLGDEDTESLAEFRYELYKLSPNEKVVVTYLRDGKEKTTTITLGSSE